MTVATSPTTETRPATVPPPPKPPKPIINVNDVSLEFADNVGVHNLTFQVFPGMIFGLIGPSGCGKTTTVRLLTGLYKPAHGELWVLDETPSTFSTRTREHIGYMPQQFVLYPQLTVWENLNFVASLYGLPLFARRKYLRALLDFVELTDARNRLGSQLSGGMQRRLALAAALVPEPTILFADEPTAGVDPVLRQKFWEFFRTLRDRGHTLFVTTQYVGEAAHCDYIAVMRAGRILHVDTPENLRRVALGGDVIRLVVDAEHEREALRRLDAHPAVHQVRRSRQQGQLFVYTDDASATLPALVTQLDSHSGIQVKQIDKYEPPFDDVFVRLMEDNKNG